MKGNPLLNDGNLLERIKDIVASYGGYCQQWRAAQALGVSPMALSSALHRNGLHWSAIVKAPERLRKGSKTKAGINKAIRAIEKQTGKPFADYLSQLAADGTRLDVAAHLTGIHADRLRTLSAALGHPLYMRGQCKTEIVGRGQVIGKRLREAAQAFQLEHPDARIDDLAKQLGYSFNALRYQLEVIGYQWADRKTGTNKTPI